MCGRYFLESSIEDIIKYYGIESVKNSKFESKEKCPGTNIPVVVGGDKRRLESFRWGYKIYGSKEIINARIETAHQKESFIEAIETKRCIIPANAFFEWSSSGRNKSKYRIHLDNKRIFSMAALYNSFIDKDNKIYKGLAVLTKPSYGKMADIHHRMPVIIDSSLESQWLDNDNFGVSMLKYLIENDSEDRLIIEPASSIVQLDFLNDFQ